MGNNTTRGEETVAVYDIWFTNTARSPPVTNHELLDKYKVVTLVKSVDEMI